MVVSKGFGGVVVRDGWIGTGRSGGTAERVERRERRAWDLKINCKFRRDRLGCEW